MHFLEMMWLSMSSGRGNELGERRKNFVVFMIVMDMNLSSSVVQICDDCVPVTDVVKYRRIDVNLWGPRWHSG